MLFNAKKIITVFAYLYSYAFTIIVIRKSDSIPNKAKTYVENRKSFDLVLFGDGINDFVVFAIILSLQYNNSNAQINLISLAIVIFILLMVSIYCCIKLMKLIVRFKVYIESTKNHNAIRPIYYHLCIFKIVLKLLISVLVSTII